MAEGRCEAIAGYSNAGQAQPKMSRVKVFYIIISIGALFSKVSSAEDKKRRSIPGRSTQHWQDDYEARPDNEDGGSDGDVEDTVWDMFWRGLHAPPTKSHPLPRP